MASFAQPPSYNYYITDHTSVSQEPESPSPAGVLEIFIHHARNIHNICIYDNQDVYSKFSLTSNPDDAIATRVVTGGGKNPVFNQSLSIKLPTTDSLLKCEIWMLSRAPNLLEDQLLGFALVPVSSVPTKGKITQDLSLSSTDLFHSPAGTVRLSLSILASSSKAPPVCYSGSSSITSEVVFLDRKNSAEREPGVDPVEYSRLEFPDISAAHQNQQMVSEYLSLASCRPNLFLHLGASMDDSEMTTDENRDDSGSPSGSVHTSSGLLSSTATNLSDDNRTTADSKSIEQINVRVASAETPFRTVDSDQQEKELTGSGKESMDKAKTNVEAEQSAMQQQIVDMYMKSMHQFTESLAKMKLPMDLDNPENDVTEERQTTSSGAVEIEKKKDGSRVFYGSRAFF